MEEKISARKTFGETLQKLGQKYKNLVVLEADLNNSLYSLNFAKTFPERHFTIAHAESLAISMAAGMATRAKIPVICGPAAALIGKGWEQIKNSICFPNLNIKIVGSNAGLSNSEEGPTLQALNDVGLLRCLPNIKILAPADSSETKAATEAMLNDFGPTYLRLPKEASANIYQTEHQFEIGKFDILKPGEDVCIFTYGLFVEKSLEAASELEKRGISVRVVNCSTLIPLDEKTILKCAENCKLLVSIEDHNIIGGLGSMIIETLNNHKPKKVHRLGLPMLSENGKFEDLLKKYQLDSKGIYEQIRNLWTEE